VIAARPLDAFVRGPAPRPWTARAACSMTGDVQLDRILQRLPASRRLSTHELVAEVLREAITSGHLKANDPLPQQEIAAQLEVSHIPVREALRQLQSEGLVTYQPNHGATVTAHTPDEIREIYEIRAILETAAVRRAAARLSDADLAQAEELLKLTERARDDAAWGSHDLDFHRLIYDLDSRPRLRELIDGLLRRVDRYWRVHGLMLKHRREFEAEHRKLLAALRARDGERAAKVLERHLTGAAELLVAALDR
jgi:DNA-binding GntR family transcriptional regulator